MRYGVVLTAGDPRAAAELAAAAEEAGWDGVFTYDVIAVPGEPAYDPWIVLAAMAMCTERVVLGAMVFVPPRRRPWKLAREAATLDVLSGGRLVLPVGLGALDDLGFGNVGEPVAGRMRAGLLDESLAILEGLWSGEPFTYEGEHHRFGPMTFQPTPVQRPRIPIWVVGAWPHERSLRRAARWDGIVVQAGSGSTAAPATPEVVREVVAWLRRERPSVPGDRPYEVVVDGTTPAGDPVTAASIARAHADAGATWWIEADWSNRSIEAQRTRIEAGPPRG